MKFSGLKMPACMVQGAAAGQWDTAEGDARRAARSAVQASVKERLMRKASSVARTFHFT